MDEEDLTLPEDDSETDSKSAIEEKRELSPEQKRRLEEQKKFEFQEVEGEELRKKEEQAERKKDLLYKWVIGIAAVLFLIGLYFWLL